MLESLSEDHPEWAIFYVTQPSKELAQSKVEVENVVSSVISHLTVNTKVF